MKLSVPASDIGKTRRAMYLIGREIFVTGYSDDKSFVHLNIVKR